MNKLYEKNEILFSIIWIIVYVITLSIADNVSINIGIPKLITLLISIILTAIIILWSKRNNLFVKYGLCKPKVSAKKMLYYLPLVILISINFLYGITIKENVLQILLYMVSMIFVGFLEEIIFRGFLFKAMCKENVKVAIIVSSVTFGMGHIVNLINGSGVDIFSNLVQVIYCIFIGFLFTIIFYKTKSLWPCIVTHGLVNAFSVFVDNNMISEKQELFTMALLIAISIVYSRYIIQKIKD